MQSIDCAGFLEPEQVCHGAAFPGFLFHLSLNTSGAQSQTVSEDATVTM